MHISGLHIFNNYVRNDNHKKPTYFRQNHDSFTQKSDFKAILMSYGPCREKTCLQVFRQREFQTGLLSCRAYLENRNFTCNKFTYKTFKKANNKGTDQTAWTSRLVCACVVRKPPKTGFLASRPI